MHHIHVLVLHNSADDTLFIIGHLQKNGYSVSFQQVDTLEDLQQQLSHNIWGLLIADYAIAYCDVWEALALQKQIQPNLPFIVIADTIGPEQAVDIVKAGAYDCIKKDNDKRLLACVQQHHNSQPMQQENMLPLSLLEDDFCSSKHPDRFARIFRLSPFPIALVRYKDGCVMDVNPSFFELTGYSAEEVIGSKTIGEKLLVEEEGHTPISDKLLQGKPVQNHEMTLYTQSGIARSVLAWMDIFDLREDRCVMVMLYDITERKQSMDRIHLQIQRLSALRRVQMRISSNLESHLVFKILLDQVMSLMQVDAADVLVFMLHTQVLEYAYGQGFKSAAIQWTRLRMGEGCAGRAALERTPVFVSDVQSPESDCVRKHLLRKEGFVSYYGVPLISKGQIKGVLELFQKSPIKFDQDSQHFLETLASYAAVIMDNAELVESLRRSKDDLTKAYKSLQKSQDELTKAYNATIEGWAMALELRDTETEGHSRRVTTMTLKVARAMGIAEDRMVHIYRGAILHDIGKMAIPDSILLKPGPLTDEERAIMQQHPIYAHKFLTSVAFLKPSLTIPYYHHERWDGTGYPCGLKGEDIPLEARIFAVVDVWDALSSDRPYRKGWQPEQVSDYLLDQSGKHFDPNVVEVFIQILQDSDE